MLGVIFADLNLASYSAGMPVAIGLVSLKGLASEMGGMNVTIATRSGWIVYDSDPTVLFSGKSLLENPLFRFAQQQQTSNGATEFDEQSGHFLGSYLKPGLDLIVLSRTPWIHAM
jgi:hypothetical protein